MISQIFNKKGGTSIAIGLLVLFTFTICFMSIFYMLVRDKSINEEVEAGVFLENVYSKQAQVDFLIQNLVDQSAVSVSSKEEFISNFIEKLNYYKIEDGSYRVEEFSQVANQLVLENVEISDGNVEIRLKIMFEESFDSVTAVYNYEKSFFGTI
jgi:hypothetical protein